MQKEIENRSVTLIINGTKLTGRVLKTAIAKYLTHRKEKKNAKARAGPVVPNGRQTVKQLVGQNAGVSNIEITDSNICSFDRMARKYGVDYAVKKTEAYHRQNISSFSRRGTRTHSPTLSRNSRQKRNTHILLTLHPLKESGKWGARSARRNTASMGAVSVFHSPEAVSKVTENTTDWNDPGKAEVWRAAWATTCNHVLEQMGRPERIDHRSYVRQGAQQIPTAHMGVAATQIEGRGLVTEKGTSQKAA